MSIKSKEIEKKLISEYVQLSNKAKILYKQKNYSEALNLFNQCEKKCIDISLYDKKCECSYYHGLCYYKLYNSELSYKYLKKSRDWLNYVDKTTFPYLKFHGRLNAIILITLLGMDKKDECVNFINNEIINDLTNKFNLEEKVVIFHRFIKDLLDQIKNTKLMTHFLEEYISEQNNILFNGEKSFNIVLKNMLNKCLNLNTKKLIWIKNNILFYKYKYDLNNANNNPIITFFENNITLSEEININNSIYMIKMSLENYIKNNKIKVGDDFKGTKYIQLIKEYIKRLENFDEVWKNIINIFSESFKNSFNNNKKIIKTSSTNDLLKKEVAKKPIIEQFSQSMKNTQKLKKKNTSNNNISNINNYIQKHTRKQSSSMIEHISLKEETKNKIIINSSKDKSIKQKKIKQNSLFLEGGNVHKILIDEKNNYDESRIRNKNITIENSIFNRNYNPFLFSTISKKYSQDLQIRPCDIINLKTNNYVKNYSIITQKGKHKVIGVETEDVNQDVVFMNPNFLLIKNSYFFGVCDGHGINGHYISSYIKQILPAYLNYIEIDNYISKKNKSLDMMLSSLYNKSENSSVKDIHIIKYFYDKFQINPSEFSFMKNRFSEISKNLKESLNNINYNLIKTKQSFDTEKSGSTVCIGFLNNKNLIFANIGDSRAILCSCNNNIWKSSQLTKDHKPKDQSEYDRIISSGGTVSRMINIEKNDEEIGPYRVWDKTQDKGPGLAMSRSIGDAHAKTLGVLAEPDIFEYTLNEGDKFIVCATDGIWEYLSNDDVMDTIKDIYENNGKAEEACEILVKRASSEWIKENNKTMDDISCAIIFLNVK